MTQFFLSFLSVSLFMTVVITVVLALRALLPKTFTPGVRYVAWIVILLGLAIPVRPLFGGGVIDIQLPLAASAGTQVESLAAGAGSASIVGGTGISSTQGIPMQEPLMSVPLGVLFGLESLTIIWAVVALAIMIFHVWKHARFLWLVKRWGKPVEDAKILAVLQRVQAERELAGKKVVLKRCGFISTSMVLGFVRPVILLPEKEFSIDELELIFHHELIHWKRGDLFVRLLALIALALNWFNPMMYVMNSALQTDCEASCDQAVIASVGSENKRFYAETIMGMVGYRPADRTALSTCFNESKQGIKTRMEVIMSTADNSKKLALATLGISLLTLVLVAGLVVFAGSVFVFSKQGQPISASMFDVDAASSANLYNLDNEEFEILPHGTGEFRGNGQFWMNITEDSIMVFTDYGALGTMPNYGLDLPDYPLAESAGNFVSSDEAIEIAKMDATTQGFPIVLYYENGHLPNGAGFVWEVVVGVDGGETPLIEYHICMLTGDVAGRRWVIPCDEPA